MTRHASAIIGLALALTLSGAAPAGSTTPPVKLQLDSETEIGDIGVACTGIGRSKEDPRWRAYPLRIEFANDLGEHLIGAEVAVSTMDGQQLIDVICWGPWLLLKPPGRASYRVEAKIIGETVAAQSATVQAPANGQARVVLEFHGVDA